MRPRALFVFVLLAAACSTPPLVGEYEGPHRAPGTMQPGTDPAWVPAKLELLADGTCWWHAAKELSPGSPNVITLLGTWHVDSAKPGADVLTVVPDKNDPSRSVKFDIAKVAGETALIAADGSHLTRTR
jgi:hypothetical protein